MSPVRVWCELVCERCASATSGRSLRRRDVPRREMVSDAKEHGWREGLNGTMLCRTCAIRADAQPGDLEAVHPR